jgi:hypothetical protein
MLSSSLPISALPEIRERIDGAERTLKAEIAHPPTLIAPTISASCHSAHSLSFSVKDSRR